MCDTELAADIRDSAHSVFSTLLPSYEGSVASVLFLERILHMLESTHTQSNVLHSSVFEICRFNPRTPRGGVDATPPPSVFPL